MDNKKEDYSKEIELKYGEDTLQDFTDQLNQIDSVAEEKTESIVLSESEKKQIQDLAKKINISDSQAIIQYASEVQRKISDFADSSLNRYKVKDTGEIGEVLVKLSTELKEFTVDSEPKRGLFRLLKKTPDQLTVLKKRYLSVEDMMNKITTDLEKHKIQLLKDITMLDKMYEMNLLNYKELTMYIIAGKQRLLEAQNVELPALKEKAQKSQLPQDIQEARDFEEMCNRFEKKLHDLELSQTVSMQLAPQIRIVQNNDYVLMDKIQSSLANTIPLWKNQIVLSLGLVSSQKALKTQQAISDATNELLKKNADMIKQSSVEVAKEAERSIIDIETIQYTNDQLISTIEEVVKVQEEGRQKRHEAEVQLLKIQNDLKDRLSNKK